MRRSWNLPNEKLWCDYLFARVFFSCSDSWPADAMLLLCAARGQAGGLLRFLRLTTINRALVKAVFALPSKSIRIVIAISPHAEIKGATFHARRFYEDVAVFTQGRAKVRRNDVSQSLDVEYYVAVGDRGGEDQRA